MAHKVAVIVNTHNEGLDLLRTVKSFRQVSEGVDLRFFIVADGTTDGSCDAISTWPEVVILQPTDRLGCGRSKALALSKAREMWQPDVALHSDGHARIIRGSLKDLAEVCLSKVHVVTPSVGPLGCSKSRECKNHGTRRCHVGCPEIEDNLEIPNNCYEGGHFSLSRDEGVEVGLMVKGSIDRPATDIYTTKIVNPSCFAWSMETLDAVGGVNEYPGWWGSQELGVSLRAWFTRTPITGLRSDRFCLLHRYRSWNHPEGKALAPYEVPDSHRGANWRYAVRVVFDDETWGSVWEPWFNRVHEDTEAERLLKGSPSLMNQCDVFRTLKRSKPGWENLDREFFEQELETPWPLSPIHEKATRALYCVAAGLGNVLMSIPAIKELYRISGEPVDLWDRGLHQAEGVKELLTKQPWIGRIYGTDEKPDLPFYKYVVGSYWGTAPTFGFTGQYLGQAKRAWRTRHEVESNLEALPEPRGLPDPHLDAWSVPEFNPPLPGDFVAVGPGCAAFETKKWPETHWKTFAGWAEKYGVKLVWLGGREDDRPWMTALGGINLCGRTTIAEAAGILSLARLYVGLDNGLSHLAAAVDCPSLLLYGPSSERKNRPWTDRCTVLRSGRYTCEPCWDAKEAGRCKRQKDSEAPCMSAIDPGVVFHRLWRLLSGAPWERGEMWPQYLSAKQRVENAGVALLQNHEEFCELLDLLRREPVRKVLEIGVAQGGWLAMVARVLGPGLVLKGVDPLDLERTGHGDFEALGRAAVLMRDSGADFGWFRTVSDDTQTVKELELQAPFDVIHIDGDHRLDGCLRDYRIYGKMVRPGGLLVFHDIRNDEHGPAVRTVFELAESEVGCESWIFHSRAGKSKGIGVIRTRRESGVK